MSARSRVHLVAVLAIFVGCQRDPLQLDEVQRMAYGVKPAVVRVSAFATAEFRYPPSILATLEERLNRDGSAIRARAVPNAEAVVETGAGGSGSGFIIHPNGAILTSGHVVAPTRERSNLERDLRRNGAIAALLRHFPLDQLRTLYRGDGLEPYIAMMVGAGRLEAIEVINEAELSNGEKLPFRVQKYTPSLVEGGTDLALLRIDRKNLPTLELGDSETTRVGESIWSVGYPAVASSTDDVIGGWLSRDSDLEATFNPGTITSIKLNVTNTPVFQSNVAIYRGNSGGPAVNRQGAVIGISTWGHTDAEQIKFLVPINVAKAMLSSTGVAPNVEGEFNRYYRTALDDANSGRWMEARRNLSKAAVLFPNSPDLIRFARDADRALKMMPAWRRHPVAAATAAGASAVAIVSVALLFGGARRRRRMPRDLTAVTTMETLVEPGREGEPVSRSTRSGTLGRFTILNGAKAGQKLGLGGSGIRIGRESSICEIVLENPKVSRLHAEVVSIDGKVLLIDRNSSNGTYVNDQKIDKRYLKDGDIIYFGGRNAVAVAFHA